MPHNQCRLVVGNGSLRSDLLWASYVVCATNRVCTEQRRGSSPFRNHGSYMLAHPITESQHDRLLCSPVENPARGGPVLLRDSC